MSESISISNNKTPVNIQNLVFVTATKSSGTEFLNSRPLGFFAEKAKIESNIKVIENNKEGLPKVYNRFLTEEYKDKYVIFVHDDVLIEDLFFLEKIQLAFEKYDVIGLAGSKTCNLQSEVPAWHVMTTKQDMVGEVAHSHNQQIWTTAFGPTNSRALILDGLFIGVNVNKALETGLKWDETFDFHHYDLSFCLKANELKVKAGVFPLRVIHYGLGDSMHSPEWTKSAEVFKKKYASTK